MPVYGGRYPLGGRLSGEALIAAILAGGGMGASASELAGEAVLGGVSAGGSIAGSFPAPLTWSLLYGTRIYATNVATGQVYYTANSNSIKVPASLTKLMSAYVLLQYKTQSEIESETTTIVSGDLTGGSGANLSAGDVITLHALLADTMLPSSNMAVTAIARVIGQELLDVESGGVGDPVARFVTEMNTQASTIGLSSSVWKNPHGIDESPNNESIPADICKLMGLLWAYPVMVGIWALGETYAMPLTRGGTPTTVTITSSNLMIDDVGVVGGKTGTTSAANLSILWEAPSGDVLALTVFNAGETGRYAEIRAMIAQLPTDFPELT